MPGLRQAWLRAKRSRPSRAVRHGPPSQGRQRLRVRDEAGGEAGIGALLSCEPAGECEQRGRRGQESGAPSEAGAQGRHHLGRGERIGLGHDERPAQGTGRRKRHGDRLCQRFHRDERAPRPEAREGKRRGRAGQLQQRRDIALHAGAVNQDRAKGDPVEPGPRQGSLGRELGAPVSLGRGRQIGLRDDSGRRDPGLRPDRGQEDEALDPGADGRLGETQGRLGVRRAEIVLGRARHGRRQARGMHHRVDAREGRRHVHRPGQVADDGAARALRNLHRTAEQDAHPEPVPRQALQQVPPDEARGTGQCDQRSTHGTNPPDGSSAVTSISTFISGRSRPATIDDRGGGPDLGQDPAADREHRFGLRPIRDVVGRPHDLREPGPGLGQDVADGPPAGLGLLGGRLRHRHRGVVVAGGAGHEDEAALHHGAGIAVGRFERRAGADQAPCAHPRRSASSTLPRAGRSPACRGCARPP